MEDKQLYTISSKLARMVAVQQRQTIQKAGCTQVAPSDKRGTLGSVNQLVICFGILGALVVNVILPGTDWRKMFYFAAIPPALVLLGKPPVFPLSFCHFLPHPTEKASHAWPVAPEEHDQSSVRFIIYLTCMILWLDICMFCSKCCIFNSVCLVATAPASACSVHDGMA